VLAKWLHACVLLEEDESVVGHWLRLVEEHDVKGKQVHDANLVAVMIAHGVTRLGTRNAADFERYGDKLQIEPVAS
jgi:predicted nucleic acid-binding protein